MVNLSGNGLRILCAILLSLVISPVFAENDSCAFDRVDLRGAWGQTSFTVELASTPKTRARGLMYRQHLPKNHGMLFIFDKPQAARFWMKNTLIPLDMIFVQANGEVNKIHQNAVPHDLTAIYGGEDVKYVLEVPAGTVAREKITRKSQLRHVSIPKKVAVWNCL